MRDNTRGTPAPVEIARYEYQDARFGMCLVSRAMEQHRSAQSALCVAHVVQMRVEQQELTAASASASASVCGQAEV
jgi:hypothetical protein